MQSTISAFVINLAKATDRLQHMREQLANHDIPMVRVEGVVGRELSLPHPDFDESAYRFRAGRRPNLGELGCYFSHIDALDAFINTGDDFGLILEDDVDIEVDLTKLMDGIIQSKLKFDYVKLSGFHRAMSLPLKKLDSGFSLSCDLIQQTGSAAYLVSRAGAITLRKNLLPMKVAYDHASTRDWALGIKSLSVYPLPVNQETEFGTQIGDQTDYRLPKWKRRLTVTPYRVSNEIARFFYRLWIYTQYKLKRASYYRS